MYSLQKKEPRKLYEPGGQYICEALKRGGGSCGGSALTESEDRLPAEVEADRYDTLRRPCGDSTAALSDLVDQQAGGEAGAIRLDGDDLGGRLVDELGDGCCRCGGSEANNGESDESRCSSETTDHVMIPFDCELPGWRFKQYDYHL